MRRTILLLAVAVLMAAMLVVAGPASAQAGCEKFGVEFVARNAPHGELASSLAPLNDEILGLHAVYCE